jgi:hypothetical protein
MLPSGRFDATGSGSVIAPGVSRNFAAALGFAGKAGGPEAACAGVGRGSTPGTQPAVSEAHASQAANREAFDTDRTMTSSFVCG